MEKTYVFLTMLYDSPRDYEPTIRAYATGEAALAYAMALGFKPVTEWDAMHLEHEDGSLLNIKKLRLQMRDASEVQYLMKAE